MAAAACGSLTNPVNGSVTVTNGGFYPSTAFYACNTGYVISDSTFATNQCVASGVTAAWTTQQNATCTRRFYKALR